MQNNIIKVFFICLFGGMSLFGMDLSVIKQIEYLYTSHIETLRYIDREDKDIGIIKKYKNPNNIKDVKYSKLYCGDDFEMIFCKNVKILNNGTSIVHYSYLCKDNKNTFFDKYSRFNFLQIEEAFKDFKVFLRNASNANCDNNNLV